MTGEFLHVTTVGFYRERIVRASGFEGGSLCG